MEFALDPQRWPKPDPSHGLARLKLLASQAEEEIQVEPLDVLHWYLGCEFIYTFNNGEKIKSRLNGIHKYGFMSGDAYYFAEGITDWYEIDDVSKDGKIELILTDPSDMTPQQKADYKSLCYKVIDKSGDLLRIVDTPTSLVYCIENHIDAFDFIERGLAIDKKEAPGPEIPKLS